MLFSLPVGLQETHKLVEKRFGVHNVAYKDACVRVANNHCVFSSYKTRSSPAWVSRATACHEKHAQSTRCTASGLGFNSVPLWGRPSCRPLQTPAESHSGRVCFVVVQAICYEPFS